MGRDRFLIILQALHVAQNPAEGEVVQDSIYKIRPTLKIFNNKMHSIYQPGKNLSLDETMLLCRGRLVFNQFIKNQRYK